MLKLRHLGELPFDLFNQLLALPVHLVLGVEQRPTFLIALGFKGLDLFLAGELFLQRECSGGGAAGFLDLAVEFLDLAFQTDLQIVGPAVELVGFGFEEAGIALGDVALDSGLALLGNRFECRVALPAGSLLATEQSRRAASAGGRRSLHPVDWPSSVIAARMR